MPLGDCTPANKSSCQGQSVPSSSQRTRAATPASHHPGPDAPPLRQACVPAPSVTDTTGAGDCFTAAFAVATLEGAAPAAALRFASAAAAICVSWPGAMPSLPARGEVEALLAQVEGL